MFVFRSTFERVERELDLANQYAEEAALIITEMEAEVTLLRAQLAERQVPAVRGAGGKFVKRTEA